MSLKIENNRLNIGQVEDISFNSRQDRNEKINFRFQKDFLNPIIVDQVDLAEVYKNSLNDSYKSINEQKINSFKLIGIFTNDNLNNLNKHNLQKNMLDNRFSEHINLEKKFQKKIDFKSFINKVEENSKNYLEFYDKLNDLTTQFSFSSDSFANKVVKYFQGTPTPGIGTIISWSEKNITINDNNTNIVKINRFLNESNEDTFGYFDNIIEDLNNKEDFITSDLLIDFEQYKYNSNHILNTPEIVAQSLINAGISLISPIHITSSYINKGQYEVYTKYIKKINNIKASSAIENYSCLKLKICKTANGFPYAGLLGFSVWDNIEISKPALSQYKDYRYISDLNSTSGYLGINYYKQEFQTIQRESEILKPFFFKETKSLNKGSVISREKRLVTKYRFDSAILRSANSANNFKYLSKQNQSTKFSFSRGNQNNDLDSQEEIQFYNLRSDAENLKNFFNTNNNEDFSFASLVDQPNINELFLKIVLVLNNLKLTRLEKENIKTEFFFDILKKVKEKDFPNLLFGNKDDNCIYNLNNLEKNIFISEGYFLNSFKKDMLIEDKKVKSTSRLLVEDETPNTDYISNDVLNNLKNMLHVYYSNNIFKNNYEFFKHILGNFVKIKENSELFHNNNYPKQLLYPKILLKTKIDNLTNVMFLKALSEIRSIDLNDSVFDDDIFDVNLSFYGDKSNFIGEKFFCIRDIEWSKKAFEDPTIERLPYDDYCLDFVITTACAFRKVGSNWIRSEVPFSESALRIEDITDEQFEKGEFEDIKDGSGRKSCYIVHFNDKFRINRFVLAPLLFSRSREEDFIKLTEDELSKIKDENKTLPNSGANPRIENEIENIYSVKSPPIVKIKNNEKDYKKSLLDTKENQIVVLNQISKTIRKLVKYIYKDTTLEEIKNQEDIVSFIKENTEVTSIIKSILDIYNDIFKTFFDKIFYLAVFDKVLSKDNTQDSYQNTYRYSQNVNHQLIMSTKDDMNLLQYEFRKFLDKEIEQKEKIYEKIFRDSNKKELNKILDYNDIMYILNPHELYGNNDVSLDIPYVRSDLDHFKLANILKRTDVSKAAYFDIVYSYLVDTLQIQDKIENISQEFSQKFNSIENIEGFEKVETSDIVSFDSKVNPLLKNYYENSIRHSYFLEKIRHEKLNLDNIEINFHEEFKKYSDKEYSNTLSLIDSQNSNNKDILCFGILNEDINKIKQDKLYKLSVSIIDHENPDLLCYEKDFFFSPVISSNSRIGQEFCINEDENLFSGDKEIISSLTENGQEYVVYYNIEAKSLKDKINIIDQNQLKTIVDNMTLYSNSISNTEGNTTIISEIMFDMYVKSGKLENILQSTMSFPDSRKIYNSSVYEKDIISNELKRVFTGLNNNDMLSIFNERKESFDINTPESNQNYSEVMYDYEEAQKGNTKLYSFIKNLNTLHDSEDIRTVLESKKYYDLYFIEVSPNDFIFKENGSDSIDLSDSTYERVTIDDNNRDIYKDYSIKDISRGLKYAKSYNNNNYNYIIRIEEI